MNLKIIYWYYYPCVLILLLLSLGFINPLVSEWVHCVFFVLFQTSKPIISRFLKLVFFVIGICQKPQSKFANHILESAICKNLDEETNFRYLFMGLKSVFSTYMATVFWGPGNHSKITNHIFKEINFGAKKIKHTFLLMIFSKNKQFQTTKIGRQIGMFVDFWVFMIIVSIL